MHIGRACSGRTMTTGTKYPASDFSCNRMSDVDITFTVCYCTKEMCNRDWAVLDAETARLLAIAQPLNPLIDKQNAQATVDVEAWIAKQAGLVSVEQFYHKASGGDDVELR